MNNQEKYLTEIYINQIKKFDNILSELHTIRLKLQQLEQILEVMYAKGQGDTAKARERLPFHSSSAKKVQVNIRES